MTAGELKQVRIACAVNKIKVPVLVSSLWPWGTKKTKYKADGSGTDNNTTRTKGPFMKLQMGAKPHGRK